VERTPGTNPSIAAEAEASSPKQDYRKPNLPLGVWVGPFPHAEENITNRGLQFLELDPRNGKLG